MTEEAAELTAAEAAVVAGVSVRSVRGWMSDGTLPAVPSRRGRLVRRADLLRVLEAKRLTAHTAATAAAAAEDAEAAAQRAVVTYLQPLVVQIERERARADRIEAERNALLREVGELRGRLAAQAEAAAADAAEAEDVAAAAAEELPPPLPWWRRIFRGRAV